MDAEKTGALIASRRKELGLTQKALAEQLNVTEQAVSRWERGVGCPDQSLLQNLSGILQLEADALLSGAQPCNQSNPGNIRRMKFFYCPQCGSLTMLDGEAKISCCGMPLTPLTAQKPDEAHRLSVTQVEDEWFVTSAHPMEREHYFTFAALLGTDTMLLKKLYPEWDLQFRLPRRGHGILLWYCNRHGLFRQVL